MKDAPLIAGLRGSGGRGGPQNPLTDQELSEGPEHLPGNITTLRQLAGITNSRERQEPACSRTWPPSPGPGTLPAPGA